MHFIGGICHTCSDYNKILHLRALRLEIPEYPLCVVRSFFRKSAERYNHWLTNEFKSIAIVLFDRLSFISVSGTLFVSSCPHHKSQAGNCLSVKSWEGPNEGRMLKIFFKIIFFFFSGKWREDCSIRLLSHFFNMHLWMFCFILLIAKICKPFFWTLFFKSYVNLCSQYACVSRV